MPVVSRYMIRCSFVYLLIGMILGSVMLINKAYPLHPAIWSLLPVHIEATLFGWVIQLTLGTAYWILPRFLKGRPRGGTGRANAMLILLNAGIICIVSDALINTGLPLRLAGRILELSAVILFISLHWNRIVTYRSS